MRFSLDEDADHYRIQSIGISVIFISFVLGLAVIPVSNIWELLRPYCFHFYLYCVTQGIYNICSSVLRGKELLVPYAISNILVTLSGAILNIVFLVYLNLGVSGYFWGFIISYIIGSFFSILTSKLIKVFKHFRIDKSLARKMCAYSLVLIPNSLMWWIMNASDRLMVISMIGASANGIYAISYKIPSAISTMSVVFNQAWSYSAIHEENSSDKNSFNEKMYNYLFELQLLITSILLFAIKPIMRIYVAESYFTAWEFVPPLLFGYFFMSLGTFFSTQYAVKKDSKGYLISGTIGALVNVVLNFLLIPRYAALGAAIATATAYISVFVYRVHDTKKYFSIKWISLKKIAAVFVLLLMAIMNYISINHAWIILFLLLILEVFLSKDTIIYVIKTLSKLKRGHNKAT